MTLLLDRGTRITIREMTAGLRSTVQLVELRWQGDRVSVLFTDNVTLQLAGVDWVRLLNLRTGLHEPVERKFLDPGERVSQRSTYQIRGAVEPPMALVVFRRERWTNNERIADVTFYLSDFIVPGDDVRKAELDVVRDAWQARDLDRMRRIAKDTLPWCHGLYVALLAKEERVLKSKTKEDA